MTPPSKPRSASPDAPLFAGYNPISGFYDEFLDENRRPRPAWKAFAERLNRLGPDVFSEREQQLQKIVQDNGITYNIYSENETFARPWVMDPIPLVFDAKEWDRLERGLTQRARLLGLLLNDVYSEQEVFRQRLLPPEVVMNNPAFLFPMLGEGLQKQLRFTHYAVDLARSPTGSWWVMSDRMEVPTGLGYAFENRSLSNRLFPSMFRELGVRRITGFINRMSQLYQSGNIPGRDGPRAVLLSPGPLHETYYEHSFLARNLGISLVEGEDLMVRDNRIFLKTITGAQPVDSILRFLDSELCDPLELRYDSSYGIAGLIDVRRQGQVTLVNDLGTGALESAAIAPFLPGLCSHFLGEDLQIPSVATWWCGQEKERKHVLEHMEDLVLKQVLSHNVGRAMQIGKDDAFNRERWLRRIQENPEAYCGQEPVDLATTPVLTDGRLEPRHYLLRVYLVNGPEGWSLMPGGLARIGPPGQFPNFSFQSGGESKDAWVLAPEQNSEPGLPPPFAPSQTSIEIRRGEFDLSSRVADNLFWLGRYFERTEHQARVLQTVLVCLKEEGGTARNQAVIPFFRTFYDSHELAQLFKGDPPRLIPAEVEKRLSRKIRDTRDPGSLASNLVALQRSGFKVKERLSAQLWNQLQLVASFRNITASFRPIFEEETQRILEDLLSILAGFAGMAMENMTRGQAWIFLTLGRRIERAILSADLLESTLSLEHPFEEDTLRNLLICADSSMTYRRRYLTRILPNSTLDLLLQDEANPRSVGFLLQQTRELLKQLPHSRLSNDPNPIEITAIRAHSRVSLADLDRLLIPDSNRRRRRLTAYFKSLKSDLNDLAAEISQYYFIHNRSLANSRLR